MMIKYEKGLGVIKENPQGVKFVSGVRVRVTVACSVVVNVEIRVTGVRTLGEGEMIWSSVKARPDIPLYKSASLTGGGGARVSELYHWRIVIRMSLKALAERSATLLVP